MVAPLCNAAGGHGQQQDDERVCLSSLIAEAFFTEVAERSEFIRAQLALAGKDGDVGAVKVPADPCKLWVRCLLRSPPALQSTDDAMIVQFVKVTIYSSHFLSQHTC